MTQVFDYETALDINYTIPTLKFSRLSRSHSKPFHVGRRRSPQPSKQSLYHRPIFMDVAALRGA